MWNTCNVFLFSMSLIIYVKIFSLVCSVFIIQQVYTSWTSMFNVPTFWETLLPSSGLKSISRNVATLNILVHDIINNHSPLSFIELSELLQRFFCNFDEGIFRHALISTKSWHWLRGSLYESPHPFKWEVPHINSGL